MKISGKLNAMDLDSKSHKKINIATPAYGGVYCSEYVKTMYRLLSKKSNTRFSFSEIDYADIVTSRNYLISNFFYNKKDCSHILFMDSDMGFPTDLIFEMIDLNEDVVGAICPSRSINLESLHSKSGLSYGKAYNESLRFIGNPIKKHHKNESFKNVDLIGAGILLISRECIGKMIKFCPDIVDKLRFKSLPFGSNFVNFITPFDKIKLEDRELSEDLSFCYRWTNFCEGKIFAGVNFEIEHVAKICIKGQFSQV